VNARRAVRFGAWRPSHACVLRLPLDYPRNRLALLLQAFLNAICGGLARL